MTCAVDEACSIEEGEEEVKDVELGSVLDDEVLVVVDDGFDVLDEREEVIV